ncbi:MAG TPA: (4Fe-4S)-binding protein [Cytophagaceae bacterium]|nr:(4Fe-4S)-binding protein [Cytophagaceae bacterium]
MDKPVTKKYSNGEITVVWQSAKCIHSGNCFRGLPKVFDPRKRPWITLENSNTGTIIEQVKKCPSGALSYHVG